MFFIIFGVLQIVLHCNYGGADAYGLGIDSSRSRLRNDVEALRGLSHEVVHNETSDEQESFTRMMTTRKPRTKRLRRPGLQKLSCHCTNCPHNQCITDGYCYSTIVVDTTTGAHERFEGCFSVSQLEPLPRPLRCENPKSVNKHLYVECCDASFCNVNVTLPYKFEVKVKASVWQWYVWSAVVVMLAMVCAGAVLMVYRYRRQKRELKGGKEGGGSPPERGSEGADTTSLLECTSSGSGGGPPLLVQRSIARQIQLAEAVGKGRYGEVWRGDWRGEPVAVKIFTSRDEQSWFREVEIYQTEMLRHPNVLGFIAADNKDNGTWTQLWLVAEYHPYGSLYDYLLRHTLDPDTLLRMAYTVANGLAHLHVDITGGKLSSDQAYHSGKPAIAHRDLKSKNILVRNNGTCCIADLGLAVRYYPAEDRLDVPHNTQHVGTKRYLAPEILDGSMDYSHFESFKRCDVYAFALVLWEMCRRTKAPGGPPPPDYQLPYWGEVEADPSPEAMRRLVVDQGRRPPLPQPPPQCPEVGAVCRLMQEGWYASPAARLTSLRIKKTLRSVKPMLLSRLA